MKAPETISYEEVLIKNILLEQEVAALKNQIEWFRKYLFGKKSERIVSQVNEKQLTFEGFEVEKPQEEIKTIGTHQRRRTSKKGEEAITLPPDLPVEQTILDLPEKEKVCIETGEALVSVKLTHLFKREGIG